MSPRFIVIILATLFASVAIAEPQQAPTKPAPPPAIQSSQPQPKPKKLPTLIVFDIIPEKGVEKGATNLLTEIVLDGISEKKMYTVVGQKDLDKMLFWEQNKQLKGCMDTACLVQIAGAMGAEFYVEGSIGVMGDKYVFTLKLIDAMEVKVIRRATETIAKDESEAMNSARRMVQVIMGAEAGQPQSYPMNPYKLWGHVSFWSGIGVLAIGGTFTGLAYNASSNYNATGNVSDKDKVGPYNTTAAVMYGLGGAMVVTGVVLWILSPGDKAWAESHKLSFAPMMDGQNTGMIVAGQW